MKKIVIIFMGIFLAACQTQNIKEMSDLSETNPKYEFKEPESTRTILEIISKTKIEADKIAQDSCESYNFISVPNRLPNGLTNFKVDCLFKKDI